MSRPIKRTVGFAIAGDGDADEPPAPSGDGDLGVGSPSPVLITPHFDGGAGVHSGAGSSPADEMTRGVRSNARARDEDASRGARRRALEPPSARSTLAILALGGEGRDGAGEVVVLEA